MFVTLRAHISPDENFFRYLGENSDTRLEHTLLSSSVFSKVFAGAAEMESFLSASGADVAIPEEVRLYDGPSALLFSDERSGSSRLLPGEISFSQNGVSIDIIRKRGLTADMAYMFIFIGLPKGTEHVSRAVITTDTSEEAGLF